MEKILEVSKEEDTLVIRLRLPRGVPAETREHFRTACREFVEGCRSLLKKEKTTITKVEIS